MELTHKAIRDFQEAYFKDFAVEISKIEAEQLGIRLLTLFSIILRSPSQSGDDPVPQKPP